MKVAITSVGPDPESAVDPRFGRCKCFMLCDTDAGAFSATDNAQNLHAAQGAGIQAAETVANLGAEAVLTGHCGPKAFRTLAAAGIKVYTGATGTVREAVTAFVAGKLAEAGDADVEGHW